MGFHSRKPLPEHPPLWTYTLAPSTNTPQKLLSSPPTTQEPFSFKWSPRFESALRTAILPAFDCQTSPQTSSATSSTTSPSPPSHCIAYIPTSSDSANFNPHHLVLCFVSNSFNLELVIKITNTHWICRFKIIPLPSAPEELYLAFFPLLKSPDKSLRRSEINAGNHSPSDASFSTARHCHNLYS